MRWAFLSVLLVLSGCSEWGMFRSNEPGSDTGYDRPGRPIGPTGPDTAPPDEEPGRTLPTHCTPVDNPGVKPVWQPGEGPAVRPLGSGFTDSIDFDARGRLLWLDGRDLHWADRSGEWGILEPEGSYPERASIKVLPNGGLVVASHGQLEVRNPDAAETLLSIEGGLEDRYREFDTLEVDSESHFFTEFDSNAILRIPSTPGHAETVVPNDWREAGLSHDHLHLALTPDEEILYVLEFTQVDHQEFYRARLYRIDRLRRGWGTPHLVWEHPPGFGLGDLAVDECGNAIVLLGHVFEDAHFSEYWMVLWYVPLKGEARQLMVDNTAAATRFQWGNGRFGWEASSLYMWVWEPEESEARLHQIPMGVKGNHVLTR